ncbi:MAG TPA: RICIN domain-containing protein [Lachnospiraceae bacterium]|nr:RICIN domain-containing protein [Lachnospiraceae bacterium]
MKNKVIAVVLCMVLSLGIYTPVYADETASVEDVREDTAADASAAGTDPDGTDGSVSELEQEMKAQADNQEQTAQAVLEENEEEEAALAAATQDTGFTVTDTYGNVLKEYVRDNVHYIFATKDVDFSSAVVQCKNTLVSVPDGFTIAADGFSFSGVFTSGAKLALNFADGSSADFCMMQSSLPSLCITLNGTTLSTIQQDKNIKYPGNSLTLSEDAASGAGFLQLKNSVEIKGRGNTSWASWPKKGYQLKFDKKQSVLGMEKAKKWVLLPYSTDISLMQDKLASDLSSALEMSATCDCRYVDFWVDGEYLGNYLVSEKVEPGNGRVNLEDSNGVICERDDVYYGDETYWYKDDATGAYYTRKETNNDDETDLTGFNDFTSSLTDFEKRIIAGGSSMSYDELSKYIDVESFAKVYLIEEFCGNVESTVSSFFLYKDGTGDVIHAGPVWDFEGGMQVRADGNFGTWYFAKNDSIYRYLFQNPAFSLAVKQIYEKYSDAFKNMQAEVDTLYPEIKDSAVMTFIRWDLCGTDNHLGGLLPSSFDAAVSGLRSWLTERYRYFFVNGNASTADSVQDLHVYRFVSAINQNYAIGIENGSKDNCANCVLVPTAEDASQYFVIRRQTDNRYALYNLGSGKVLDVSGGSSAAGANIWQYVYNGSGAQRWVIDNAGDGSVVIRDALGTILDVSGGKASGGQNIWAYTANRSDAQRFYPQEIVTHAEDEAVDGGVYTISPACAPGKCLDVSGAEVTNGTNIRQYAANSTDAQKFLLTKNGDFWTVTCYKGGKAIDVAGGSAKNGTNVWEYRRNGSAAQDWTLTRNADGSYSFDSRLGKALDISGASGDDYANAQIYDSNGSSAQKFFLTKQDVPQVYDGTYRIVYKKNSGLCASALNSSTEPQANIELESSAGGNSQYFTIFHVSASDYCIVNEASGLYLDVRGGGMNPGTNIWQYSFNGTAAQRWQIEQNADGSFSFISVLNQLAMDAEGGEDISGTNIWCYTRNSTAAQEWLLQ